MKGRIFATVYVLGVIAMAMFFVASGANINSDDEAIAMFGFCVLWPLTVAYIAVAFVVLLCLGWRGGAVW